MGLDAFVRCRCFEEGKLKPGPIPFEDLYIDEEDFICSKFLDLELSKQVQRLVMVDFPRALPTQTLTWP